MNKKRVELSGGTIVEAKFLDHNVLEISFRQKFDESFATKIELNSISQRDLEKLSILFGGSIEELS